MKDRETYEALDWLLGQQARIENGLARRHLEHGMLVLYDVSSSYVEGRLCPLAQYGHSRDHRSDRPQIVYGLLWAAVYARRISIAVEVFAGNTADPKTLAAQIEKPKTRFGIERVVLVGDRGMITAARKRGLQVFYCLRTPVARQSNPDCRDNQSCPACRGLHAIVASRVRLFARRLSL